MSVASIDTSSYSAYMYQWKNQGLQEATTNPQANSNAASAYSYNGLNTVSSMVELVKYAMDEMGVESNASVTFSQVEKYKAELEEQFNQVMQTVIGASGISDTASFSMTIAADGTATVMSNHEDASAISNYFAANPQWASDVRKALTDKGLSLDSPVAISISASGEITVNSSAKSTTLETNIGSNFIVTYLENGADEGDDDSEDNEGTNAKALTQAVNFIRSAEGKLSVDNAHPQYEALQAQIDADPSFAEDIDALLEAEGVDLSQAQTFTLNTDGTLVLDIPMDDAQKTALQEYFADSSLGTSMKNAMQSEGIDPNIDFRLSIVNGKVTVNSTHADAQKIQALFDGSEELSKLYMQVDALAGLESARKSMQVDPATMRNRLVIENMAAWWSTSSTTSSIGSYFSGSLSTFSGVNSIV